MYARPGTNFDLDLRAVRYTQIILGLRMERQKKQGELRRSSGQLSPPDVSHDNQRYNKGLGISFPTD
jgi:hypothetical protein